MVAANTWGMRGGDSTAARRAAESRLAGLRQKLREALAQRQTRMKEFVEACKADRRAVREHVREMRARSLRDLQAQIQAARGAAKLTRLTRLAEVRQVAGGAVQQARAAAAVEKAHQAELARLAREERSRGVEIRLAHDGSLAAGALRSTLLGKLAPLFERDGRGASAPGESRAEAVFRFAERNPEKAHAVVEPSLHRRVEETKRAVAEAERSVRATGGDLRVGSRPSSSERGDRRDRQERAMAQGASPLPGQPRIGPVPSSSLGQPGVGQDRPRASNDTTSETARGAHARKGALGKLQGEGANEHSKPSAAAAGSAGNGTVAATARDGGIGQGSRTKAPLGKGKGAKAPRAPKRAKPSKTPKAKAATPSATAERQKGQIPRSGGGIALADLLQERDEIAAAKSAKSSAKGNGARGGKRDKRASSAKKIAAKPLAPAPSVPRAPGVSSSSPSYAAWCELVSQAAGKHGRRIAFGSETHDAWKAGTGAEAFVLTQPLSRLASPAAIVRNGRSGRASVGAARASAAKGSAPGGPSPESATKGPILVTSTIADTVKPYRVRASCGHIAVRPMRAATAGVPYSPDVILNAPKGRACDACEAKHKQPDFGAHAPKPAPKKDVKAPELTDTAQIAKRIRADIADAVRTKKLPKGTYAVRTSKYSMGSSIYVVASKLPFPLLNPAAFHLVKGSSDIEFDRDRFRSRYTAEADRVLATLNAIVDAYHWDRSDPITEYYHSRFGRDVKLDDEGEWERINEVKRAQARSAPTPAPTPTSVGAAPGVLPSAKRAQAMPASAPASTPTSVGAAPGVLPSAKRAQARAAPTPASTPTSVGAAPAVLPSPPRVEAPKPVPATKRGRTGRSKAQQTLDTDSPLFAGALRFVGAPAAAAEGPTKSEEGGSEP
jgi:hypothetical protein